MAASSLSPGPDRAEASVSHLTKACISKLEECSTRSSNGDRVAMENRLADLRLWADGVGATAEGYVSLDWRFRTRSDDLIMVKTILIMLQDFLGDYATLAEADQPTEDAVQCIDSSIENLALIGVAIRRTGKASRRRRVETSFDPKEYEELKQHLECIVLLRPSKAGLQNQLDSSNLNTVQKRLIEANLMRRHRTVVALKRSQRSKQVEIERTGSPAASHADKHPQELGQTGPWTSGPLVAGPKQRRKERGPKTMAGMTAASTAEGSLRHAPEGKYTPGAARTQITALAADTEFPRPPRISSDRLIGRCPCCCQSISVEEMLDVNKWREHVVEDLCPYTCIIEDCPAPHLLFSTRKEWEAHVKTDHRSQWHCPLCEEHELEFQAKDDIVNHFQTRHQDAVHNLTLSTLLHLSESRRMGIDSCPLCSSYGREDSPEIIDHVLRHVFEFSLRALPWTKPIAHDLAKPVGTFALPEDDDVADRLVQWIADALCDPSTQLQLSSFDGVDHSETEPVDAADEDGYVADSDYFDDASLDDSSKPQAALTELDLDSDVEPEDVWGHNQPLHIVLFKCARADVFYIQEGTGLTVKPGDLVIVEADRGTDLGTVATENVDWQTAKELKEHYAEEQYKWLMMYSRGAPAAQEGASAGLVASSTGLPGSAVGGMGPPNPHYAQEPNAGELRPKLIKRLAQIHEVHALRDKEGQEAKAKRVCMQKVKEHSLNIEILDAEFQMDWKKLTFYYVADSYINFNSLVADLFQIYKTRIWMSAINPASFPSSTLGIQSPSGIGPGAVNVNRATGSSDRRQNQQNQE